LRRLTEHCSAERPLEQAQPGFRQGPPRLARGDRGSVVARRVFGVLAAGFVAASLFHAVAIGWPQVAEPSPAWRHGLFVGINLAVAAGLMFRPRWFVFVFLLLTGQQLLSHGVQGWRVWQHEGRLDWASVVVVLALPPLAALLAWQTRRETGAMPRAPAICAFVRRAWGRGARGTCFLLLGTRRRPKRSLAKCAGSRRAWYRRERGGG
jgi:hypothetical protein